MFGGMKNKLQEMQQKMEETKARLDTISVTSTSEDGSIRVVVNANRKIISIENSSDKNLNENDSLTSELLPVINDALEKASKVAEAEMSGIAQGMLPNMPGLFK